MQIYYEFFISATISSPNMTRVKDLNFVAKSIDSSHSLSVLFVCLFARLLELERFLL